MEAALCGQCRFLLQYKNIQTIEIPTSNDYYGNFSIVTLICTSFLCPALNSTPQIFPKRTKKAHLDFYPQHVSLTATLHVCMLSMQEQKCLPDRDNGRVPVI